MEVISFDGEMLSVTQWGTDHPGVPVVLCHGFASDTRGNFVAPGIVDAIVGAGHRVIGIDARGHGWSAKPHDPTAYADEAMARDVSAVLDALTLSACHLVGYSMGAITAYRVAQLDDRVRSVVLGGVGGSILDGMPERKDLVEAMEAFEAGDVSNPAAQGFRRFAEQTGADVKALAAMQRAPKLHVTDDPKVIDVPALVLVGEADTMAAADAERLAAAFPNGRLVRVPGDHLSAVGERAFAEALVAFLAEQG
jgi:pimeloyl-ACP methyl ester carboxylesterase